MTQAVENELTPEVTTSNQRRKYPKLTATFAALAFAHHSLLVDHQSIGMLLISIGAGIGIGLLLTELATISTRHKPNLAHIGLSAVKGSASAIIFGLVLQGLVALSFFIILLLSSSDSADNISLREYLFQEAPMLLTTIYSFGLLGAFAGLCYALVEFLGRTMKSRAKIRRLLKVTALGGAGGGVLYALLLLTTFFTGPSLVAALILATFGAFLGGFVGLVTVPK